MSENNPEGLLKFDADKPRWDLLMGGMPNALEDVAKILTFGAKKYSPGGWKTVANDSINRYKAALHRHLNAIEKGELNDPESGLPHIAHVACNALFLGELIPMEQDFLLMTFHDIREKARLLEDDIPF